MVLDTRLYDLTMNAFKALDRRLMEHLGAGGHEPRVALPQSRGAIRGWPAVETDRWNEEAKRPNPVAAFGYKVDQFHPITWSDLPEMSNFLEYVLTSEHISSRITVPAGAYTVVNRIEGALASMTRSWAADFPLSILARSRAVHATAQAEIDELYAERERSWLADSLPIEYFVPLVLTSLDAHVDMSFPTGARVESISDGYQLECGRHPSSHAGVSQALANAATHALIVDAPDLDNEGPAGRFRSDRPFDPNGRDAIAQVDRACEALRIVSGSHVGYATIFVRPLGWADHWASNLPCLIPIETRRGFAYRFQQLQEWPEQGRNALGAEGVRRAGAIFDALGHASSDVRLAARRLTSAANRDDDDDKLVDACIGFEALLGDNQNELTHRLCQRTAYVLATGDVRRDPVEVYAQMKKIYGHRSKVVHGGALAARHVALPDGAMASASDLAVELLREVLLDKLERAGGWKKDDLDALVLGSLKP